MKGKPFIESASKSLLALIPYGGQLLSEAFFDYRSRVKQDRINKFIELLLQYLEGKNLSTVPVEIQESEDFGDLFESIVRRVTQTNSVEKAERFKNVIGEYVFNPIKIDYRDTYLDLIERLNEIQIKILKAHANIKENIRTLLKQRDELKEEMFKQNEKLEGESRLLKDGMANNYHGYTRSILNIDSRLTIIEKAIKFDEQVRKAEYYCLENGDYLFLIQDLYSKGLLIDQGVGALDTNPFETMGITAFALGFLKFINEQTEAELETNNYIPT